MSLLRRRVMGGESTPDPVNGMTGAYIKFTMIGSINPPDRIEIKFNKKGTCNPHIEYCVRTNAPSNNSQWTVVKQSEFGNLIVSNQAGNSSSCIYVRGYNPSGLSTSQSNYFYFVLYGISGGYIKVEGNIMYLVDCTQTLTVVPCAYCFYSLFSNVGGGASDPLRDASGVIVCTTSTTAKNYCYASMFKNDNGLSSAPSLPLTTLQAGIYQSMFENCTLLKTPPSLPATTLREYCYQAMFKGCTKLTSAPTLPGTQAQLNCYNSMFANCTSLTTAPSLPAVISSAAGSNANYCYESMFSGCKALTTAPPTLSSTNLSKATYCYRYMFKGCVKLTTAPVISAITLSTGCFTQMFYGCVLLNYIKAMFTTAPSTTYMDSWVSSVASSGTFVKNSAATWTNTFGTSAIPSGWTVQTASS